MEQLNFVTVMAAIITLLETETGHRCYDSIPKNAPLPHYWPEFFSQEPLPSKTFLRDRFTLYLHAFAAGGSSVPIFDLINKAATALAKQQIVLPDGYDVLLQSPFGVQRILEDDDESKHAVMGYRIDITYGMKCKI